MASESPGSGWGQRGCRRGQSLLPTLSLALVGGGWLWELGTGEGREGGRGNKVSLVLLVETSSVPTPTAAIDYIQFLHKEKKKQEEEVSMLRKDVTALKIMKV